MAEYTPKAFNFITWGARFFAPRGFTTKRNESRRIPQRGSFTILYKRIPDEAEQLYQEPVELKSMNIGLSNDKYNEALEKFNIAANEGGFRRADFYIGPILDNTPNAPKAVVIGYYRKAADMGDPRAKKRLEELGASG